MTELRNSGALIHLVVFPPRLPIMHRVGMGMVARALLVKQSGCAWRLPFLVSTDGPFVWGRGQAASR